MCIILLLRILEAMNKVFIYYHDVNFKIKGVNKIKSLISLIFKRENRFYERINFIFCTDDYLLEFNRKYLKHDFYTDIITFDFSDNEEIQAEAYISIERVKDNAHTYEAFFFEELIRVIIHGTLHLCGYNDKTESQKKKMRNKENEYIGLLKSIK